VRADGVARGERGPLAPRDCAGARASVTKQVNGSGLLYIHRKPPPRCDRH
jgi:hypothetical protein